MDAVSLRTISIIIDWCNVCFSIEHPEIQLGSVHNYRLCIAEDDGEVDWAFPCLECNEPCSKFGFTCLGLVELKDKNNLMPALPLPEEGLTFSGVFSGFPKATDSGQSNQNPSRHNTGGSATSEAVIRALKAVNDGMPNIIYIIVLYC